MSPERAFAIAGNQKKSGQADEQAKNEQAKKNDQAKTKRDNDEKLRLTAWSRRNRCKFSKLDLPTLMADHKVATANFDEGRPCVGYDSSDNYFKMFFFMFAHSSDQQGNLGQGIVTEKLLNNPVYAHRVAATDACFRGEGENESLVRDIACQMAKRTAKSGSSGRTTSADEVQKMHDEMHARASFATRLQNGMSRSECRQHV